MEWNLLALGYDNYTNYIKLPQSILAEFNKSDDNIEVQVLHKLWLYIKTHHQ